MTAFLSRLVIAAIGIPIVLALVYVGGWWLFGLAALAGLIALHEFYVMARPLRPLVLAGFGGAAAALVGAQVGGIEWMVGGFLATFLLAFFLFLVATTRAPATVAISGTVLGASWIGFGLGFVLLLRDFDAHGRLVAFTVLIAVWADDTAAYFTGRLIGRFRRGHGSLEGERRSAASRHDRGRCSWQGHPHLFCCGEGCRKPSINARPGGRPAHAAR